MKIKDFYIELAKEFKPKGMAKEDQEWAKGVLEALYDWQNTSFSDLCKAIGYSDGLEMSIQSKLKIYFTESRSGVLKNDGTDKYTKQWIDWNKMVEKDNAQSIAKAFWTKPEDELDDADCKNVKNVFNEFIKGVGEQIKNEKRIQKINESEQEKAKQEEAAAVLEDAEEYVKEKERLKIEEEKKRLARIKEKEEKFKIDDGEIKISDVAKKLCDIYASHPGFSEMVDDWFYMAMGYYLNHDLFQPMKAFVALSKPERTLMQEHGIENNINSWFSEHSQIPCHIPERKEFNTATISSKQAEGLMNLFKGMNELAHNVKEDVQKFKGRAKLIDVVDGLKEYNHTSKDSVKWFDDAVRSILFYLQHSEQEDYYPTLIEQFYTLDKKEKKILDRAIKRISDSDLLEMMEQKFNDKNKMIATCKEAIVLANGFKKDKDIDMDPDQAADIREMFETIGGRIRNLCENLKHRKESKARAERISLQGVYDSLAKNYKKEGQSEDNKEWFDEMISALRGYDGSLVDIRTLTGDDKFDVDNWKDLESQKWYKEFGSYVKENQRVIEKIDDRSNLGTKDTISTSEYRVIEELFRNLFGQFGYVYELLRYKEQKAPLKIEDVCKDICKRCGHADDQKWFEGVISLIKGSKVSLKSIRALTGSNEFNEEDLKDDVAIKRLCESLEGFLRENQTVIEKVEKCLKSNGEENLLKEDYDKILNVFLQLFWMNPDYDFYGYVPGLLKQKKSITLVSIKDVFDKIGEEYNPGFIDNQKWCKRIIEKIGNKNSVGEMAFMVGHFWGDYEEKRNILPEGSLYRGDSYSEEGISKEINTAVEEYLGKVRYSIKEIKECAEKEKISEAEAEIIERVFYYYLSEDKNSGSGIRRMLNVLERCEEVSKKLENPTDNEQTKSLKDYYDRFEKFVRVQDNFLNDKKNGFKTCDEFIYDFRKKVLPGLDESYKEKIPTREEIIATLGNSGSNEKMKKFEKTKGFKDVEIYFELWRLKETVESLLEDETGLFRKQKRKIEKIAERTIDEIINSIYKEETVRRKIEDFIGKANLQSVPVHDKNVKDSVKEAIKSLCGSLNETIDGFGEALDVITDNMADVVLESAKISLSSWTVRYSDGNEEKMISLEDYSYKEKSSTATWIQNLYNEVTLMLESQVSPEDKIKRLKNKLLDIPKMSSSDASINDKQVKKAIQASAKKLDEFFEKVKSEDEKSIELSTKDDKAGIVKALKELIDGWKTAIGQEAANNYLNLQAGTIYQTLREAVANGIENNDIIRSYKWKKGSKTAEWLKKLENDVVKGSKKLDPLQYVTNFRKNVNDLPILTFKKAAVKYDTVKVALKGLDAALEYRIEQLALGLVAKMNEALNPEEVSEEKIRNNLIEICNDIKFAQHKGYGRYFLLGSENRKKLDALINSRTPDSTLAELNNFEKAFKKYLKNIFEKNGTKVPAEEIALEKADGKVKKTKLTLNISQFKEYLNKKAITKTDEKKSDSSKRKGALNDILPGWKDAIDKWNGVNGLELGESIQNAISSKNESWGSSGATQKWLKGVANSCPESVKKKYNPVQILEELRKAVGAVPKLTFKESVIKDSVIKKQIDDLVKSIKAKEREFQKDFKDKFEKGINGAIKSSEDLFGMTKSLSKVINQICSDEYYENKNYFEAGTPMYVAAENFKFPVEVLSQDGTTASPKYKNGVKKLEKSWKELKKAINKCVMISLDVDLPELK